MSEPDNRAGSLFFGMTLKTSDFKKKLKGVRKDLKEAARKMRASFASIATAAAAISVAFVTGATALLLFSKSSASATNEQLLLADSLGATQAEIAALEVASIRFGVSQDMLIDKMREAGGVDAFKDIANQVNLAGDASAQLAKAQELLGNEGLKLLPILQQGAIGLEEMEKEARGLGLALNPKQIAETRSAWGTFENTILRLKGIGKQIGASLLKPFMLASSAFDSFMKTFKDEILGGFKSLSDSLNTAMITGLKGFRDYGIPLIVAMMSLADNLGETFSDVFGFISSAGKSTFSSIRDFIKGFIEFLATFKQTFIAAISTAISTVLTFAFNGLAKFSDFIGVLISGIASSLEYFGLVEKGFGDEVKKAFKEQGDAIRGMGKDLAAPFKQAANDSIDDAAKILEDNESKVKKYQSSFSERLKELLDNFGKEAPKLIKDAAIKGAKLVSNENKASMVLTGSQEEARILSGQSDKNLKIQQDIRKEAKITNRLLLNLRTT